MTYNRKVIEEWSYPLTMTKEEVEADTERVRAIGYCKVVDAVLVEKRGEQTNNNYIKSETVTEEAEPLQKRLKEGGVEGDKGG